MEAYRLYAVVPRLVDFIDLLTNWYIRLSRRRFWKNDEPADKGDAYATLYEVLTTFAKVMAPFMPFLSEFVYQRTVLAVEPGAPASVHFTDFPQAHPELTDRALERRMAVVRTIVSLGRRLREEKKLKVRQPLATFTVVSRDPAVREAALAGAALVREQLNVKAVATSSDEAAFCSIGVKPNFVVLKERAASKLKDIGKALASFGFPEVSRLETGETIEVAGEQIALADVLLARTPVPGKAVATEGDVTVVLETALSEELILEGVARELNSVLQQARKALGLEVSDRVRIAWDSADPSVVRAVEQHAAWLAEEVLAVEFGKNGSAATEASLNGKPVRYTLAKS